MPRQTVNPFTNEVLKTFDDATKTDIDNAIFDADKLYQEMKHQPVQERSEMLHKIAQKMRDNAQELAEIATKEMGKLINESKGEVELCAMIADYFADQGEKLCNPHR
ncbi:succinate-semialdehyde dehydrogenase [NAD] [Lentilactobacillus kosonis]|uniref:Succinate-semialdehyde dehydrogenase [NAD] n=1 Tax=Lentilactobacillus kosonis TaxID=2810561 RepID=A0A401FI13_9LACO|nr:succinate-semialdehyde dehydrogenase [NAD] [Lentilactobacillus kosonis]